MTDGQQAKGCRDHGGKRRVIVKEAAHHAVEKPGRTVANIASSGVDINRKEKNKNKNT